MGNSLKKSRPTSIVFRFCDKLAVSPLWYCTVAFILCVFLTSDSSQTDCSVGWLVVCTKMLNYYYNLGETVLKYVALIS